MWIVAQLILERERQAMKEIMDEEFEERGIKIEATEQYVAYQAGTYDTNLHISFDGHGGLF